MTTYDTNGYLTQDQMTANAQFILDFFTGKGWSKSAICGMLGNMQSESGINFGIYESLDSSSSTNGFGLTQWTPNTKYFDWASANGYGSDHVNGEVNRLIYESQNEIQWFRNPLWTGADWTFAEFIVSNDTPENLANVWVYWYEHPANPDQPNRATQARTWYDTLTGGGSGGGGGGGTTPPPTTDIQKQLITLWLTDALHGWK